MSRTKSLLFLSLFQWFFPSSSSIKFNSGKKKSAIYRPKGFWNSKERFLFLSKFMQANSCLVGFLPYVFERVETIFSIILGWCIGLFFFIESECLACAKELFLFSPFAQCLKWFFLFIAASRAVLVGKLHNLHFPYIQSRLIPIFLEICKTEKLSFQCSLLNISTKFFTLYNYNGGQALCQ